MIYVALLRGINVGGKNKVEMARLRQTFERLGLGEVRTYINSGNVIFTAETAGDEITSLLEDAIERDFGLRHPVLVRDLEMIERVEKAIPEQWVSDSTMRTDVLFLWDEINSPSIIDDLPVREGVDRVVYVDGAVIWQVDIENINRSGRSRIVGGRIYKAATVRNANTTRKLAAMMREAVG